jgi:hypothetical protein
VGISSPTPEQFAYATGDAAARERGRKLGHLRDHWGEWYDICHDGTCFVATRKDGSLTLRASADSGLHALILADYMAAHPLGDASPR